MTEVDIKEPPVKNQTKKKSIFDDDDFLKPTGDPEFDSVFGLNKVDNINWFPITESSNQKKVGASDIPDIILFDKLKEKEEIIPFQPEIIEEEPKQGLEIVLEGTQLSIVGQNLESIPSDLGDKYPDITNLVLTENSIRKVDNLDKFTKLQTLILDSNMLEDEQNFPFLPNLETLWVNSNQITDIEKFLNSVSSSFPNLKYLSMLKNPACPNYFVGKEADDYQRYRYYVLHRIKNLKFLDSKLVDAKEKKEATRIGHLMIVTRETRQNDVPKEAPSPYAELPQELRKEGQAQATFGVCRYVYYGRQSEGNRFILNTDL